MRAVRHPNICALFAVYEDDINIYMILEYCPAGDLYKRVVKRGKLNEYQSARFI